MDFSKTEFCSDPAYSWAAGDIVRFGDWPFADAVILGFNEADDALLSRPYVYASGTGTTGPVPLLGYEKIVLYARTMHHAVKKVDKGRVAG